MINLFINYYKTENKARRKEIDNTLILNIENPLIDKIFLLIENKEYFYKKSPKIEYVYISKRPTYQVFFEIVNRYTKENNINIISNSDIYFDDSLNKINISENECFALSRDDILKNGLKFGNDSQDCWIFRDKIKKVKTDICLGVWGCDNAIANILNNLGYSISNPSLSIKCFHNHKTQYKANNKHLPSNTKHLYMKPIKIKHKPTLKYKFSVIMPSFLGDYKDCATNREFKFVRAVKSVLSQTFDNYELIIIADGCEKTILLYTKYFNKFANVKCLSISKQNYLSGCVRQIGIDNAKGEYIIYLDTDDFYGKNHLSFVDNQIDKLNWCYFNDIINSTPVKVKNVSLEMKQSGTSSICHKKDLPVSWIGLDGYTHDMRFIERLMKVENYKKLSGTSEYFICHIVNEIDV